MVIMPVLMNMSALEQMGLGVCYQSVVPFSGLGEVCDVRYGDNACVNGHVCRQAIPGRSNAGVCYPQDCSGGGDGWYHI